VDRVEDSVSGRPLIREIESRDVERVLAIQAACPEVAQWIAEDYGRVVNGDMSGWVAMEESQLVGFLIARRIVSDIEILNLAVIADSRRRGIGASLLQHSLEWAGEFRAENAILEVRESNLAALQFYNRHGFKSIARRARYYVNPADDALVLSKPLLPPQI
jgi:ribosomal-protein-alanine N-acetyltransferase